MLFDDEDATNLSVQERRFGFMIPSTAQFRHMSVFANTAWGPTTPPKRARPPKRDIADGVEQIGAPRELASAPRTDFVLAFLE